MMTQICDRSTKYSATILAGVTFSRTVLNPGPLTSLLPAVWQLRLHKLHLVATDMPRECWETLKTSLLRPTLALAHPPPEWWCALIKHTCLRSVLMQPTGRPELEV